MNFADFIGQTLDDKYKIERELGRGGMGTVYLATHLGTERPVAVKIIAPQFMQRAEFVERFRREARAAGRLRHPNVVDVTDFGFSNTDGGQVAYLVMEYLDGCTLGEILDEEKNLPVGWTLDILEQVCSAVHEAHEQGIIHRDLKPDNIWLEPNQRGGYTVKVLDFGIAKLEETMAGAAGIEVLPGGPATRTLVQGGRETIADSSGGTRADGMLSTQFSERATVAQGQEYNTAIGEAGTLIQTEPGGVDENKTAILPVAATDNENGGTTVSEPQANVSAAKISTGGRSLFAAPETSGLTRVGAVLGTPLYMSPEQCRGEKLDARSDVYSLSVIAYQMLSGRTPFDGDFKDVMEAHKESPPPPLVAKKVKRRIRKAIYQALAKDPAARPQTAEAFATEMRAQSEGIWALLRRAGMIYTEHLPKFVALAGFFSIPIIVVTLLLIVLSFLKISEVIDDTTGNILLGLTAFCLSIVSTFCTHLIIGTITWVVAQLLAVPLRPVKLRSALREARKKWKAFAWTGILGAVLTVVLGTMALVIGILILTILWTLSAAVVMMENISGWKALKRSQKLVMRAPWTATAAVLLMILIPSIVAGTTSFVINVVSREVYNKVQAAQIAENASTEQPPAPPATADEPDNAEPKRGVSIGLGGGRSIKLDDSSKKDMGTRVRSTISETLFQLIWLPMQLLTVSFTAIIIALLYLKTRQAGGECMHDLLEKFEETDRPRKKWQERVRQRLIQSGRITSRST